jgi:ABC-type nitrate/sulfonate/bicarbonate transport system permease component
VTRRVVSVAVAVWLPIALLVLWWLLTRDGESPYFPPLGDIWDAFRGNWLFSRFGSDLLPSVLLFLGGYVIASVLGVVLGVLLGLWPLGRRALVPLIDFMRSVPAPALISILIVLIGFGVAMKLTVIAFTALFPILLNTIDGVRGVSPQQLDMAKAYRLRWSDRIFRIVLPAASPQIFAGLRVSLAVALAVLVFAEMLAGTEGLGYFIYSAQETYQITDMWSGIVVIGLIGYAVNVVFVRTEHVVLRWHRGWRTSARNGE